MPQLTVSKLAQAAGVSADTIRFYEREGLLHEAPRSANGYRVFGDEAAERMRFIRGAQTMGLRLRDIRELLDVRDRGLCPCGHAEAIAKRRIEEIDDEMAALRSMKRQLVDLSKALPPSNTAGEWPCEIKLADVSRGGDCCDEPGP